MRSRGARLLLETIAVSLLFVRSAHGASAPLESALVVLPFAPGAYELSLAKPAPARTGDRPSRIAGSTLAGLGLEACAVWAAGVSITKAKARAIDFTDAAGFTTAGLATTAALASWLFPNRSRLQDARVFVLLGPGGAGVSLAGRF